jgi:hypothetical protein
VKGDVPIIDHLRWSPSCGFAKGLNTGNIPASLQEPSRSNDVCGPHITLTSNSTFLNVYLFILVRIILTAY